MGCDKALIEFRGQPLLRHAISLAAAATGDVRIVGDPIKYGNFGLVTPDVYPGHGPLGGIHSALVSSKTDLNLILATDLPFLDPGFLRHLITLSQATNALVTTPKLGHYFEPLCAIYRRKFADIAEAALSNGKNKIDALFAPASTRAVSEEEIVAAGFSTRMFRNLNTPDDLAQAVNELA